MIYSVIFEYNIEADTAARAIDIVLSKSPMNPMEINCKVITDEREYECE